MDTLPMILWVGKQDLLVAVGSAKPIKEKSVVAEGEVVHYTDSSGGDFLLSFSKIHISS